MYTGDTTLSVTLVAKPVLLQASSVLLGPICRDQEPGV